MLYDADTTFGVDRLVRECCDSAIIDLDPSKLDSELGELIERGYVAYHAHGYSINTLGAVRVRQVIVHVRQAVEAGMIPKSVIDKQSNELKDGLETKNFNLPVFMNALLRNVEVVLQLIVAALTCNG